MTWLDRYIHAVKAYLPKDQREDIGEELKADLQDEIEHREARAGAPLSDEQIRELLHERGHPMLVAADFQPRRVLVSESLFPLYTLVLKWLLIATALVHTALALIRIGGEVRYTQLVAQWVWGTLNSGLYTFAWLTLVFYLLGEALNRTDVFKHWRVERLPQVMPRGGAINRTGSVIEWVVLAFALAWLNQNIPSAPQPQWISLVFSAQWIALLPWINATLIAAIAISAAKLIWPFWSRGKIIGECALYAATLILLGLIASWETPLQITLGNAEQATTFDVPARWIQLSIAAYAIAGAVDLTVKIRRFMRA